MTTPKKSTRGGARPGAGRKPSGRTGYTIRMHPGTMKRIKREAHPLAVGVWLDYVYGGLSPGVPGNTGPEIIRQDKS